MKDNIKKDYKIHDFIIGIFEYEKRIENIYKAYNYESIYEGFIFKLDDYNSIKEKINFNKYYNKENKTLNNDLIKLIDPNETVNIKKLVQINIKSKDELIKAIKNKNEYIIIDSILYQILCNIDKDINPYIYIVNENDIKLILQNNEIVNFSCKNNILNELSYMICNDNKITNLSDEIINYYKFENKIIDKSLNNSKDKVYLVDKGWIDKWKKYINYDKIKNKYLKNYKNEKHGKIKYDINKEIIIYHKDQKKIEDPGQIKLLYFKTIKELRDYNKKNSIVIINNNCFSSSIKENELDKKYNIKYCNDIITIYINKIALDYIINSNILYSTFEEHLKILIRIFYYQEKLNQKIKINNSDKDIHNIGIIKKDWISKFKNNYQYKLLSLFLKEEINLDEEIKDYDNLSDNNIERIIRNLPSDYKNKIIDNVRIYKLNNIFEDCFIYLEKEINKSNKKKLKYIQEFEIVNIDIITSLNKLYTNFSHYFEGELYINNDKVLISFKDTNNNYNFQVGKIENNIYILDYLIDFNETMDTQTLINTLNYNINNDYFFNNIYYNNSNNKFKINDTIYCFSYKLFNQNNNDDSFKDYINNIKKLLLSFFLFDNEFNNNISQSRIKNDKGENFCYTGCYLIDKYYFNEFKNLFYDVNLEDINKKFNNDNYKIDEVIKNLDEILKKNRIYYFDLLSKQKIQELFGKNLILNSPIVSSYLRKEDKLIYPINFDIINEDIYNSLVNLETNFNIKIKGEEIVKSDLIIKNGKIIFKHPKFQYLLLINIDYNNKNKVFRPERILNFLTHEQKDEYFMNILKNINNLENELDFIYNDKNEIIGNIYNIDNNEYKTSSNINEQKKVIIKKYLKILIMFYKMNETFKNKMDKNLNEKTNNKELELFIINRKWIDEFKYIFYYDEILPILVDNKKILMEENNNKNDEIIDRIINQASKESKIYFSHLKETSITNKLNKIYLYEIFNYEEKNNIKYFHNCGIINMEFLELLKNYNININLNKIKKGTFLFRDNKIFIENNQEKMIYIGIFDDNSKLFITQMLIYSTYNENIKIIYENIKLKGYNYIEKLILKGKSINTIDQAKIKFLNISELLNKEEYNISNNIEISEKLKALLLLFIHHQKNFNKIKFPMSKNKYDNNHQLEEVYLLNNNFLHQLGYYKLKKIITNDKVQLILESDNNKNEEELLSEIIKYLDLNKLKEFENNLEQFNIKEGISENFFAKKEKVIISKNNSLNIFNNFIIVDESIVQLLINNFNIDKISFIRKVKNISGNEKNLIIIDYDFQNTILFGNILNDENIFKLEYIFEYKDRYSLNIELEEIINDYNLYNKNRILFNQKYENDYISPIFDKTHNEIIGHCYKYKDNIINNNYLEYQLNPELKKMIYLYINYKTINYRIKKYQFNKNNQLSSNVYYLVNGNLLKEYKNIYNYDILNKELNSNINIQNIFENNEIINKKNLFDIIKNINPNINIELNKKNNIEENEEKNGQEDKKDIIIEPKIISFDYFDNSQEIKNIMVYSNFEILRKDLIKYIFNITINNNNFTECNIISNYFIINFPYNIINESNKFTTMIGILNNENKFIIKYVLIYDKDEDRSKHLNSIKKDIGNYLNGLPLLNNSSPITGVNYEIIGTIIKIDDNNCIKDYNIKKGKNANENLIHKMNKERNNFQIETLSNSSNNYDNFNIKEDEYCLDYNVDYPYIKSNFNSCPLIGLQNIGATCYMNATLQCFCHIEKFINFFKYNNQIINIVKTNKNNLSSSFKLLIEKLWPNNINSNSLNNKNNNYAPEDFKIKISKMNPLFEGIAANDAKDLVNFIIMTLHEELNKAKNINLNNNMIIDQTNKMAIFQNFTQNFSNNNQSIISDLFYSMKCNVTECSNCNIKLYNYQIYFFLVFPLEEVGKFKNQYNNNYNYNNQFNFYLQNNYNIQNNNNEVNIYDCFNYDQKVTIMSGDNSMYCNYCKTNCSSSMYTYLVTGPEVLILLLNRGKGIEFNIKIYFEEYLNLYNYIEYKNTGFNYKLIGVITHIGESGMSGHFIAYCRDPITEKWHKYNDSIVNEVRDFQKEVIDFAMPYLLFYQKIN